MDNLRPISFTYKRFIIDKYNLTLTTTTEGPTPCLGGG